MRYEGSKPTEKTIVDYVLTTINFILVVVILLCFNYMMVSFLFQ